VKYVTSENLCRIGTTVRTRIQTTKITRNRIGMRTV
jgi:hypothetical protein